MKVLKQFNQDIVYKVILQVYDNCSEYCLVNANDDKDIYLILNENEVKK